MLLVTNAVICYIITLSFLLSVFLLFIFPSFLMLNFKIQVFMVSFWYRTGITGACGIYLGLQILLECKYQKQEACYYHI